MRWIAVLCCLAASMRVAAIAQAPAAAPAPRDATHLMLPPAPKPLLPDSFAGWVAAEAAKAVTDPAQADPANAAALKEYDFTDAAAGLYKRSGETLSRARAALSRRQRSLWRLFLLSPEWLAQRADRVAAQPRTTTGCSSGWATPWWTPISPASGPCPARRCASLPAICRP